ncbi:MAG: hypothetical protein SOY03_06970 [Bariatricus sp.]|uniref:hypothetical protein n=2 Tax=unclassified Bariatricus TaxID=2677046 RepID=UPI002A8693D7|nr:hypothetical protein [Bariatricus sp.]
MYYYRIGNLQFCWRKDNISLSQDEFMERYLISENERDTYVDTITYESRILQLEDYQKKYLLQKNETYELYETDKGCLIIYHWATCRFGFGYWLEELEHENHITCYFHPNMVNQTPLSAVRFFSCAGMHSKFLQHGDFVLHASYIDWNGKGIVFAAPSGTGKSTQAKLWEKYAGAEIINGDRVLLGECEGKWYGYGYPCCGSSTVCINRTLPLAMVVILEQGAVNQVLHLTKSQKTRALVTGTQLFLWNKAEINRAFEIVGKFVQSVPVVKLICRPDKDAVDTLKKYWEEGMLNESI